MQSAIQKLRQRYSSLNYFDLLQAVNQQDLTKLSTQIHLRTPSMTKDCQNIMKKVKNFAEESQIKLKQGRKLIQFLKGYENQNEIILNNKNICSLEILQNKEFQNLTQLQLNTNQIQILNPLAALKAPQLQFLDISHNKVSLLKPLSQCKWPRLRQLLLYRNRIQSLAQFPFQHLNSLKQLNLSDNFIRQIRSIRKKIRTMNELNQIDLSNNYIMQLHSLRQWHFVNLRQLSLHNNFYTNLCQIQAIENLGKSKCVISVSHILPQDKMWTTQYKNRSVHSSRLKIIFSQRTKRQTIQTSRKLKLG